MAPESLTTLSVGAASVADDLALVALGDVSAVLHQNSQIEARLLGGAMMMLHVHRLRLGDDLLRETKDADIGFPSLVARVYGDIEDALLDLGYRPALNHRYVKAVNDIPVVLEGWSHSSRRDRHSATSS